MTCLAKVGITLTALLPLLDGEVPDFELVADESNRVEWSLSKGGSIVLSIDHESDIVRLTVTATGLAEAPLLIGLRFGEVRGVRRYLRNGYHSWDGSFFADPGVQPDGAGPETNAGHGFAMTALMPLEHAGAAVLGFERHDRFQNRFRFGGDAGRMTIDAETMLDRCGATVSESLLFFAGPDVEDALIQWSQLVASASPLPPRVPDRRITGWCSWYNLYAAINEQNIREHLKSAEDFRERYRARLDVFLIDDGFTPEMGDWLDVQPQFPNGLKPLLADIREAGFVPGLWIAPFMVGNRSRLFADHPDWVVREVATGEPLVQMEFYGEFRWHKRSEEYYILDITHPGAERWIREVFRTWSREWGARYFKTDFMFFGAEHGPDRAKWHEPGLSRIAVWRRMATIIREEIGESLWLGCGCPLWASVGLVDAVRIGRDVGTRWSGDQSAESLLRDQATRNHAAGWLWQADPDCILLRDRFHHLTDAQVESLALLAGLTGGVLMTSDKLDEVPPQRAELFARLSRLEIAQCRFPAIGNGDLTIIQRTQLADGNFIELTLDTETGKSQCRDRNGRPWP